MPHLPSLSTHYQTSIDCNKPRLACASHFDLNLEIERVVPDELVTCEPLARVELPVPPPAATPLPIGHSAVVIVALK